MTTIFFVSFGRKDFNFSVVTHIFDLVNLASALYLIESKKVKSFFFAKSKGFTLSTNKLSFKLRFGKNFFRFIFFDFKKNFFKFKII